MSEYSRGISVSRIPVIDYMCLFLSAGMPRASISWVRLSRSEKEKETKDTESQGEEASPESKEHRDVHEELRRVEKAWA